MRKRFANSCKKYTGPSAAWLLRGTGQDAFADYIESSLTARGSTALALETVKKCAGAAARLGLYCADELSEFRDIREASRFWPKFALLFVTFYDYSLQTMGVLLWIVIRGAR